MHAGKSMHVKRGSDFDISRWIEEDLPGLKEVRVIEEKTEPQELKREEPLDLKVWIQEEVPDVSEVRLLITEQTKRWERQVAGALALGLLGVVTVVTIAGILDTSRWQIVKEALSILVPLVATALGYYFGASGRQ